MIQLFHVSKWYQKDVPALHDTNLHIPKGDFVFITGPSGAGKSTLLKLLFADERPTKGQVLVHGRNIARLPNSRIPTLRREIGVVFQDFKLLANRNVFENVALALEVIGTPRREISRRVWLVLKRLGIDVKIHVAVRTREDPVLGKRWRRYVEPTGLLVPRGLDHGRR